MPSVRPLLSVAHPGSAIPQPIYGTSPHIPAAHVPAVHMPAVEIPATHIPVGQSSVAQNSGRHVTFAPAPQIIPLGTPESSFGRSEAVPNMIARPAVLQGLPLHPGESVGAGSLDSSPIHTLSTAGSGEGGVLFADGRGSGHSFDSVSSGSSSFEFPYLPLADDGGAATGGGISKGMSVSDGAKLVALPAVGFAGALLLLGDLMSQNASDSGGQSATTEPGWPNDGDWADKDGHWAS